MAIMFTVILNTVTKHKICKAEILNAQVSFCKALSFSVCLKSQVHYPIMAWLRE